MPHVGLTGECKLPLSWSFRPDFFGVLYLFIPWTYKPDNDHLNTYISPSVVCVINRQNIILKYGMRGHFCYRREASSRPPSPLELPARGGAVSSACGAPQRPHKARPARLTSCAARHSSWHASSRQLACSRGSEHARDARRKVDLSCSAAVTRALPIHPGKLLGFHSGAGSSGRRRYCSCCDDARS